MTKTLGLAADRLLDLLVPKTTAGACPCNDSYCTPYQCAPGKVRTARTNCDCSKTTYSACYSGWC
jgi:hypothetical protein